jgi:hypothetical protein
VRIVEDEWPIIAEGKAEWWSASNATRAVEVFVRVRQHADGRAIVYGRWKYETRWHGERGRIERVGSLLESGADVVAAIRSVGDDLCKQAGGDDDLVAMAMWRCIADLPAEEI